MAEPLQIRLSPLDFDRFGIRTAIALNVDDTSVKEVLDFCRQNDVELCIARCSTAESKTAQGLEEQGFRLMDTLIYYELRLRKVSFDFVIPKDLNIRISGAADATGVRSVAARCFKGYRGHYHSDRRLPTTKCDETYADWAFRATSSPAAAEAVLVAEISNHLCGFATLRQNSAEEAEGVLFAVDPSAQGRGLYKYLLIKAAEWCLDRGVRRMIVSTQIVNVTVQKAWSKLGFEPSRSTYTFHRWFTKAKLAALSK